MIYSLAQSNGLFLNIRLQIIHKLTNIFHIRESHQLSVSILHRKSLEIMCFIASRTRFKAQSSTKCREILNTTFSSSHISYTYTVQYIQYIQFDSYLTLRILQITSTLHDIPHVLIYRSHKCIYRSLS